MRRAFAETNCSCKGGYYAFGASSDIYCAAACGQPSVSSDAAIASCRIGVLLCCNARWKGQRVAKVLHRRPPTLAAESLIWHGIGKRSEISYYSKRDTRVGIHVEGFQKAARVAHCGTVGFCRRRRYGMAGVLCGYADDERH